MFSRVEYPGNTVGFSQEGSVNYREAETSSESGKQCDCYFLYKWKMTGGCALALSENDRRLVRSDVCYAIIDMDA